MLFGLWYWQKRDIDVQTSLDQNDAHSDAKLYNPSTCKLTSALISSTLVSQDNAVSLAEASHECCSRVDVGVDASEVASSFGGPRVSDALGPQSEPGTDQVSQLNTSRNGSYLELDRRRRIISYHQPSHIVRTVTDSKMRYEEGSDVVSDMMLTAESTQACPSSRIGSLREASNTNSNIEDTDAKLETSVPPQAVDTDREQTADIRSEVEIDNDEHVRRLATDGCAEVPTTGDTDRIIQSGTRGSSRQPWNRNQSSNVDQISSENDDCQRLLFSEMAEANVTGTTVWSEGSPQRSILCQSRLQFPEVCSSFWHHCV